MKSVPKMFYRSRQGLFLWARDNRGDLKQNTNVPKTLHIIWQNEGIFETLDGQFRIYRIQNKKTGASAGGRKVKGKWESNYYGKLYTPADIAALGTDIKSLICGDCIRSLKAHISEGTLPTSALNRVNGLLKTTKRPAKKVAKKAQRKVKTRKGPAKTTPATVETVKIGKGKGKGKVEKCAFLIIPVEGGNSILDAVRKILT